MTTTLPQGVTQLLVAWSNGNESALDQLIPLVYQELRRLAHRYMRHEQPGHGLQTTALVHEAYLRLTAGERVDWRDRNHFFAVSARVMRRILIDIANSRTQQKHGGGAQLLALEEALTLAEERDANLLALNDALETLATLDPRKAQVIELRYFIGLSVEDTAAVLKVSPDTVMRDWRLAKMWLLREISRQ